MVAEVTKQTMMHLGQTELFRPHPEVILSGDKTTKTTTF
jgi:hypothetical protein